MALHDHSNSQTGDISSRDAAGRDIVNQGADANAILDFLRAYVVEANQTRETVIKETKAELVRVQRDFVIVTDALRTLRDRVDDMLDERERDKQERIRRQRELDEERALRQAEADRYWRLILWWLGGLTLALLGAGAVIWWLVAERGAAVGFVRAVYDLALVWRR